MVCCKHFSDDDIRIVGSRFQLKEGSVPSVFMVDCIELPKQCERCDILEVENKKLHAMIAKLSVDSQIEAAQLTKQNDKLKSGLSEKSTEIVTLNRKIASLQQWKSKFESFGEEASTCATGSNVFIFE